jgi:hypothetical protein
MTEAQYSGDLENIQVHNLAAAAALLLERAAAAPAGRAALTNVRAIRSWRLFRRAQAESRKGAE